MRLRLVLALLALSLLGTWIYSSTFSARATAAEAAGRFWAAVVNKDEATLSRFLAPEADFRPNDLIVQYAGLTLWDGHNVHRALPNKSGVTHLVLSTLWRPHEGSPHSVMLAVKKVDGQWRVVRAGSGFSY